MWINLKAFLVCITIWLIFAIPVSALPLCLDVFTDPPTYNQGINTLVPPPGVTPTNDYTCAANSTCDFSTGDKSYATGIFKSGSKLTTQGVTSRLYFNNLTLENAQINTSGNTEDLFIYVSGSLTVTGNTEINAILYINGSASFSAQSYTGAIAAGGSVAIPGLTPTIDLDAVAKADLTGVCENDFVASIHHFEIAYSANPLICTPEVMTIRACGVQDCSQLVTETVAGELSVSDTSDAKWVGGSSFNLVSGQQQVSLQGLSLKPVTLGISASNPVATNPLLCSQDGSPATAGQCTLSFADSGFIINVPDKVAGQTIPANKATIKAVKKSDNSASCIPAFANVTKTISFWSSYISPNNPVPDANADLPQIKLGGIDVAFNELTATSQTVTFDSSGKAKLAKVDYADAGKVALNAKYQGAIGSDDEGLVMRGSGEFVSVPEGLCIEPETICSAGDETCPSFKVAGETFNLNISGRAWDGINDQNLCNNPITPNYAHDDIVLATNEVKVPTGGEFGELGVKTFNFEIQSDGSGINTVEQSISEVGVFTFSATPPPNYLASNFTVKKGDSQPVGRFVPKDFVVQFVSLTPSCTSGYSYMGQTFSIDFNAKARNINNKLTKNYMSRLAFAETARLVAENDNDGSNLGARLVDGPILNWNEGQARVTAHALTFKRPDAPILDGPFDNLAIGVIVKDDDAGVGNANMDAESQGDCVANSNCTARRLGTQKIRFGRVRMDNVNGPEYAKLSMPAITEYWTGTGWSVNSLDSCTSIGSGGHIIPKIYSKLDDNNGYDYKPDLSTDQDITRTRNSNATKVDKGRFELLWQNVGTERYRGSIQAPLKVEDWLKFYWNWDGNTPKVNYEPRSKAHFGSFRGHDKVIYWRERN